MAKKSPIARYLTLAEAAEMLSVSTKTIRRWISDGTLPGYTVGRPAGRGRAVIRVKLADVEATVRRIPAVGSDD